MSNLHLPSSWLGTFPPSPSLGVGVVYGASAPLGDSLGLLCEADTVLAPHNHSEISDHVPGCFSGIFKEDRVLQSLRGMKRICAHVL